MQIGKTARQSREDRVLSSYNGVSERKLLSMQTRYAALLASGKLCAASHTPEIAASPRAPACPKRCTLAAALNIPRPRRTRRLAPARKAPAVCGEKRSTSAWVPRRFRKKRAAIEESSGTYQEY
eukprot:1609902-Pleurochrysis_carterae.AAC.1